MELILQQGRGRQSILSLEGIPIVTAHSSPCLKLTCMKFNLKMELMADNLQMVSLGTEGDQ